jgi:sugar lactone lactonase YvrE
MSEVSVVADYRDLCGECPVWDHDSGCLYWTDIDGRRFYRYDHARDQHEVVKHGLEVAGYALNQPGGFVIANSDGIWLWDGADDLQLVVAQLETRSAR